MSNQRAELPSRSEQSRKLPIFTIRWSEQDEQGKNQIRSQDFIGTTTIIQETAVFHFPVTEGFGSSEERTKITKSLIVKKAVLDLAKEQAVKKRVDFHGIGDVDIYMQANGEIFVYTQGLKETAPGIYISGGPDQTYKFTVEDFEKVGIGISFRLEDTRLQLTTPKDGLVR